MEHAKSKIAPELAVRWFGYARGDQHAFMVPVGKPLEGNAGTKSIKAECDKRQDVARLGSHDERPKCMGCVAAVSAAVSAAMSPGRCMVGDEPLTARHKVPPVGGSVAAANNGQNSVGVCSLCGTHAVLSEKGFLTAHVVRSEPLPASPALSEPNMDTTDTGARVGDPESGSKRRAIEIDGAFERGTVEVKIKDPADPKAKAKLTPVPATADNLRLALRQALESKPRKPESVAAKLDLVARLRAQLDAAVGGTDAMKAPSAAQSMGVSASGAGVSAGQRGEGRIDGVALVQGREEKTLTFEQWQETGKSRSGPTTLDTPLGRERADRGALGASVTEHDRKIKMCADGMCDHVAGGTAGYLTYRVVHALPRRKNRRYWEHVATKRERAKRARAYVAKRVSAPLGTGCSTSEGSLVDAGAGSSLHKTATIMERKPR